MFNRLPKRHNVEPVFQIVSQLLSGFPDLSLSDTSEPMGDCYRAPADSISNGDALHQDAPKKLHRLPPRRAHRKSKSHGEALTNTGMVVSRSKSVDDLTATGAVSDSDDEATLHPKSHEAIKHSGPVVKQLLRSKDQQIAKLIDKLTAVFECNNQFAVEHEKLQKDYQRVVQNLRTLETIQPKSCDRCAESETERGAVAKESADLRNDLKMMKILVYRLNVQIERYQDAVREGSSSVPKLDFVDSTYGGTKDNLNWGPVNTHTLGPLLNAYEETIAEKADLVQQYESELIGFTGKMKKVLEENEALQKAAEERRTAQAVWVTERTRLQAQVDVLRSKAEVQGKRADLAKEKLVEVLKCYEQKVQAQSLDIERLQEAYTRSKVELTSLRNINQNPEVISDSLKECQKLLEDLRLQYSNDRAQSAKDAEAIKADLQQKSTELEQLRQEHQHQLTIFERQKEINEILMGKNTTLKQTLERTRQSKEILKQRLKTMISWGKGSEQRKDQLQECWRNIRALQAQLQQRDAQMQSLQQRYQAEHDQLQRRLRQREDTLRKILMEKAQFHRQG
ncbi:protein Cep89 homolog [Anopheles nili]|uniref:protein Cep89 homolog n=1 Tax=Anopheles nili TaxID=185578 RepID=UPI00237A393F|nr:protein Cep89 homolog [Anopheles nili]